MKKMRIGIYAAVIIGLAGCAGMGTRADAEAAAERRRAWEAHLQSRMGMDINEVIGQAGPPVNVFKMPNGDSVYTWARYSQPVTTAYAMPMGYGSTYAMSRTTQSGCRVDYTVGSNSIAKSWRYEGNGCY